ncbi:MAG: diguanylate cyclase [Alkaliphilus sp.]
MQIINNRYRVERFVERDIFGNKYIVVDLIQNNNRFFLHTINNEDISKPLIEFCVDNFLEISSRKNPALLEVLNFGVVDSIDDKTMSELYYYYTTEYLDSSLVIDLQKPLPKDELVDVYVQLARAIDYLHFCGDNFKYIHHGTVSLFYENGRVRAKLMDIISLKKEDFFNKYSREFYDIDFLEESNQSIKKSSDIDIFSFGAYLYYLLTMNYFNRDNLLNLYKNRSNKKEQWRASFISVIYKMVRGDENNRYNGIHDVNKDIKDIFELNYTIEDKTQVDRLNFNIPLVGRESELKSVFRAINQNNNKLVLIRGAIGMGKSRLIDEVCYRMKLKKYNVFTVSCSSQNTGFHSVISSLLRQVIKLSEINTIMKYAKVIVKIIPDMLQSYNITPSKELPEDREILRLFDRVSNFIVDSLDQKPTIIAITNFNVANQTVVEFIDYLQKLCVVKKSTITLLIGLAETEKSGDKSTHYANKWLYDENVVVVKLNRLSIQEAAKMFSYISGWRKEPLRLATRIMEKTEGIPSYIGGVIREMYDRGSLRIDYADTDVGFAWHLEAEDYETIARLDNIDDIVKKQLSKFNRETKKILEIVSIFKSSITSEIIKEMLKNEKDNIAIINKLIQLGILQEELEDRGFSYSFKSSSVKEFVYKGIMQNKRLLMHRSACSLLEELFKSGGLQNKEELIYHLISSNQKGKALDYYIEAGEDVFKLNIYTQALHFYNKALELIEDEEDPRRTKVLTKIGDIKKSQGDNEGALKIFFDLLENATTMNNPYQRIDLNNRIASIMVNRNEQFEAKNKLELSLMQAEKIKYNEGLLEAVYLLTRIYMNGREIEKIEELIDDFLPLSRKIKNSEYAGKLLSQKGVVEFHRENFEKSLECFKDSIREFENGKLLVEASRPYNNMGVIWHEYLTDKGKAKGYFEKALEISKQFHLVDIMTVAWANLAEICIEENKYCEAIEFLNKSAELAEEYGEESLKFNANLNLITCYIRSFDYYAANNYLRLVQKNLDINKNIVKNFEVYYLILLEFMNKLGKFEEVAIIAEKAFQDIPKMSRKTKAEIETQKFFAETMVHREVDERRLDDVVKMLVETSSHIFQRHILLKIAEFYVLRGEESKSRVLLEEDKKLIKVFNNTYLELYRRHIRCLLEDSEELFEQLLIELLPTQLTQLKWKTHSKIGSIHLKNRNYFKAVHSFLSALDIIESLLNKIPEKYRRSYLLLDNKYEVVASLRHLYNIVELQQNEEDSEKESTLVEIMKDNIEENLFDVAKFRELFQNDKFYKLALQNYTDVFPSKVNDVEELISSLTGVVVKNLDLVLNYIGTITLATKGAIIKTTDKKIETIAHFGDDINLDNMDYLFSKISNNPKNMILEIKYKKDNLYRKESDFADYSSNAIMCIPVLATSDLEAKVGFEQRKWKNIDTNKVEAYIYLETEEIFNNFTRDSVNRCKEIVPLVSLMLRNHRLTYESSMDKMTGIYNRAYFEKEMNEKVDEAKKLNLSFSIIMCDIDHFKTVNDRYGHQRGDMILANTGRVIKESVRETDIVGRYGGEEFIILLSETNKKDAFYVAENIRLKFNSANLLGMDEKLTISCGIASYPDDAIHTDSIIEKADIALYSAKESGRNATAIYKEGMEIVQNRADKLAGIITGNSIQDQRNMLAIIETLEVMVDKKSSKNKMFIALGRLIEVIEAEEGVILFVEESIIKGKIGRKRFVEGVYEDVNYNESLISKSIETKKGDFLIDWENISHIDILTGTPNWKSVIVSPIIVDDELKGIVQLSVSAKEKEFDFNTFNFTKLMCNIMGAHI